MTQVENWHGHDIRFVEKDGEWWAVVDDVCDALNIYNRQVLDSIDSNLLLNVPMYETGCNGDPEWLLVINEIGIYCLLELANELESRKFRSWTGTLLQRFRKLAGLKGYEVFRMTDDDIQAKIDGYLDSIFYDEEADTVMISVTVAGGDVMQYPLDEVSR